MRGYTNPTVIYEADRGLGDWVIVCKEVSQDGSCRDVELHFPTFNQLYEAQNKMLDNPYPVHIDNIKENIYHD